MAIQQEHVAVGANKRRHRPSGGLDDEDHHLQKKKQARRTTVLLMEEYTAEDVARFNEEMSRSDKLVDDFEAKMAAFDPATAHDPVVSSFTSPCLQQQQAPEPEPEEVVVGEGGRRRMSKASIKIIRSFAGRSGYHPFSERLLSNPRIFTQATADKVRAGDRIMSKLYAQAQARAREILHHYDAKGYLEYTADGAIDLST